MSKKIKLKLDSFHRKDLERSGLKNKTIRAARFHSMSDTIRLSAIAGCKCRSNLGSCLVIPYRDITGKFIDYAVIKPKHPRTKNGKCIKYEAPSGQPNHCYFPPNIAEFADDASCEVIITEGEKKTLAAFQSDFACIGVSGVWNWKQKNQEELIPDFNGVNWFGRDVKIVFDSDAAQSDHIQLAEMRLAGCLTRLGARVTIVRLPNLKGFKKTGLDDFLMKKSPGELKKILRKAEPPGLTNSIHINLTSGSLLAYTGGFPKSAGGSRAEDNKGKRDTKIPLHPSIVEHLRKLEGSFGRNVFAWNYNKRTLWNHFHQIQESSRLADGSPLPKAGKEGWYGFHDFRRGFATENAEEMDLFELQTLMQHKSLETTKLYVGMTKKLNNAVNSLKVPDVLRTDTA